MQVGTNDSNSVKIDPTFVAAFNAEQEGTIFTPSIVINYGNGFTISTSPASGVPNFVPIPPPPISFAANGVTIRHTTGLVSDVPAFPWFIQANLRGTGTEWFAVVDDNANTHIYGYSRNQQPGKDYFTTSGQLVPFNNIVTTHMTNMSFMLASATTFNQDISSWDTSKVTTMSFMFNDARTFNQPIGSWDTSNVTQMHYMFENAVAFNKPIGLWNTAKVTNMRNMFYSASAFNQNISAWNTSSVTDMTSMFFGASAFNQNISSWQVYNLTSKPNKPGDFDTDATALLANSSYPTTLPDWAMAAPVV
jgi:surface protein